MEECETGNVKDKGKLGEVNTGRRDQPEVEEMTRSVLRGNLEPAYRLPHSKVKIFVCSTMADFYWERRRLWEEARAELQNHFLQHGLDLDLIDLHQGRDVDYALERQIFDRYVEEMKQCTYTSYGPFFLILLGDKYGPAPLPSRLGEEDFTRIRAESSKAGRDVNLLDEWYKLDLNAVPAAYMLQPVSARYKHIQYRERVSAKHDKEISDWTKKFNKLQSIIHGTAASGQTRISALEEETRFAVETNPHNVTVVQRHLTGLPADPTRAERYVDDDGGAAERLDSFREYIVAGVPDENRISLKVAWCPEGLEPQTKTDHALYLEEFNEAVVRGVRASIERAVRLDGRLEGEMRCLHNKHLYREILTHLVHCRSLGETARVDQVGFSQATEDKVNAQWLGQGGANDYRQMVLVVGSEGSGKSCFIARLYHVLRATSVTADVTPVVVVRFAGLTRASQTTLELLHGICCQLQAVVDGTVTETPKLTGSLDTLSARYQDLLAQLAKEPKQPVFILLDGLEALKPPAASAGAGEPASGLHWLDYSLPSNVHVIATVTAGAVSSDPLGKLVSKLRKKDCLIELPVLSDKASQDLLTQSLALADRTLTPNQKTVTLNVMKQKPNPLYQRLLAAEIQQWTSACTLSACDLPTSLEDAINGRFDCLEHVFGGVLTASLARYLSAALFGLTELELTDLLSCNDEVLLEILPASTRHLLRLPYATWLRLKENLSLLVEKRYVDFKWVLCWSHRSVALVAAQRYRTTTEDIKRGHREVAELFRDTWVYSKPLAGMSEQQVEEGRRFVCPQPLLYSETKYNHRKLNELWYQLLQTGDMVGFKEYVLCDFEYLLARLHSTCLQTLLNDLSVTLAHALDAELLLINHCVMEGSAILSEDPLQLASELIGRLRQVKDEYPNHIEPLIQQCMEWCDSFHLPILVPLSPWLPDPRMSLVTTLECSDVISHVQPTSNGQHIFCSMNKNEIAMYHVAFKKLIRTLSGHRGAITCLQMAHKSPFLLSGSTDSTLRMWDVVTGKNIQTFKEHSDAVLCLALTRADDIAITGSKDRSVKVTVLATGEVMHSIKEHMGPVTSLVLNKSDAMLITGSTDKTVKIYSLDDMTLLNTVDGDLASPVCSIAVSADDTFLLMGCEDESLYVKSLVTGSDIHSLVGHRGKVQSLLVSKDCFHCLVGCSDGNVYLYNLRTTELLDTYSAQKGPITCVKTCANEHFIFSASKTTVSVWTFFKRYTKSILTDEHNQEITCVSVGVDGKTAISGSKDKTVKLWNLDISDLAATLEGHEAPVTCVALAAEDEFAVTGSEDTTVKVWSVVMGCVITDYREHQSVVTGVWVLSDNHQVLSAEVRGVTRLWQAENGVTLMTVAGPTDILHVSPSSVLAISGESCQNTVKLWKVDGGEWIQTLGHAEPITCLAFSADSQYIISGSSDKSLKVWEAPTGKLTQVLVEHEDLVSCVAVTESNRHVVSGSHDRKLLVWGLSTGITEHHLIGHKDHVTCVKVTKDGTTAISGSKDGTLRVWNINLGMTVTVFDLHEAVQSLFITKEANRVVAQLYHNMHLPLLCLHNSPAEEVKSQSQINIQIRGDSPYLPLRPKPLALYQHSGKYARTRRFRRETRPPSISSIPEIIKGSPIKAPLQKAVRAQQHNRECRETRATRKEKQKNNKNGEPKEKKSHICHIL